MAEGTEGSMKAVEEKAAKKKKATTKTPIQKGAVKFEIYVGVNNLFYWRFVGSNGSPIVVSKGTAIKEQCFEGIRNVKANANIEQRYDKTAQDGKFSFKLRAANHKIVGESVSFEKADDRDHAMIEMHRASEAVVLA